MLIKRIPIDRSESPIPCERALMVARRRITYAAAPEVFMSRITEEAKQILQRCQNDKIALGASPEKMRRVEEVESAANKMLQVAKDRMNVSLPD